MKLLKVYVGMCAVCVLKLGVHGRLEVTFQDLIVARVIFAVKGFSFHADVPLLVFMVSVSYCCISLVWIFFSVFFIDAFFLMVLFRVHRPSFPLYLPDLST